MLNHGSGAIGSNENKSVSLNTIIDDIVEMVAKLHQDNIAAKKYIIPLFVIFLIYKTAVITTAQLLADMEPKANTRRLRVLRNVLKVIAERWLAGGENLY
jgi:hypothetical protein